MPDAGGKTNRTLTTFLDNTLGGQDSTVSGSSNKEDPPGGAQWPNWDFTNNGNATGKSDYGRVAAYSFVKPVSGTDHVFLVLGFDRGSNVGGNATANLNQPNVLVTDYLPGFDPARPSSGATTYVAGSAKCIGADTCPVTGPAANGLITWSLGDMPAGTSRQVTFQVTIDDISGAAGETVAADILNAGAVKSDRTPATPSNEVVTPVTKVLGVKISQAAPATPARPRRPRHCLAPASRSRSA